MVATRLSDSQKTELVARFRAGASGPELAAAFGCSPNTAIRVVKSALDPADYEQIKLSRLRRAPRSDRPAGTASQPGGQPAWEASESSAPVSPLADDQAPFTSAADRAPSSSTVNNGPSESFESETFENETFENDSTDTDAEGAWVLPIDDADDFSGDQDEIDGEDEADEEDLLYSEDEADLFTPIALVQTVDDHAVSQPLPLAAAQLPASAYMLVDKTVELQARPLSDFPEFGRLPPDEQARQALLVFANPRQAKRQCGRTQRVIKLPDPHLLARTAPYLLAQGISRVVIEGALYALPGS
jgi:hypothetical protein